MVGDAGPVSACFALPLKAATAAITLFGFFVGLGVGSGTLVVTGCLPISVLARPRFGLVGLLFDGELSLVLSPLPCVSIKGARSALFFRENVSSNDVVGLGMCMDFGRSFDIGRFGGEDWPGSNTLRCFCGE